MVHGTLPTADFGDDWQQTFDGRFDDANRFYNNHQTGWTALIAPLLEQAGRFAATVKRASQPASQHERTSSPAHR